MQAKHFVTTFIVLRSDVSAFLLFAVQERIQRLRWQGWLVTPLWERKNYITNNITSQAALLATVWLQQLTIIVNRFKRATHLLGVKFTVTASQPVC